MSEEKPFAAGGFHKDPEGNVWKSYGMGQEPGVPDSTYVMAYQYKGENKNIPLKEIIQWERLELSEFPGCDFEDKALPYVFDLLHDIKTYGRLAKVQHDPEIQELIQSEGIDLGPLKTEPYVHGGSAKTLTVTITKQEHEALLNKSAIGDDLAARIRRVRIATSTHSQERDPATRYKDYIRKLCDGHVPDNGLLGGDRP